MAIIAITGANSGFGLEGALAFARRGDTVYATMRDPERGQSLQEIADAENLDVRIRQLDVTQPESFGAFVEAVVAETGAIDVLVNNAGILRAGAFEDLAEGDIRAVMETNFFGPMLLTRKVLPVMRKQGSGIIIMISSLSGVAGLPGDVAYSASKFALEGATESLRHEVDRWGIRVALVQAAQYRTNIFSKELGSESGIPPDYPHDSPYRPLVEARLNAVREGMEQALDPRIVGALLIDIVDHEGSRLRWPADELSERVLGAVFGQDDVERDQFLRGAGDSDWWSAGKDRPVESK